MRRAHSIEAAAALACMLAVAALCWPPDVAAEQLPIRHYGVYEGLPHSTVRCIFQDSRGYLWIGTADGLARFDGYRFTNYDTSDGLGHTFINAITEDHEGRVWIATNGGGVSCFVDWTLPASSTRSNSVNAVRQKFVSFKLSDRAGANSVNSFLFDSGGRLWCVTDGGLYRGSVDSGRPKSAQFELLGPRSPYSNGAFADNRGRLWFGNGKMIIEAVGDRLITYGPEAEFGESIRCFAQERQGRLIAVSSTRLLEFVEPSYPASPGSWKSVPLDISEWAPLHHLLIAGDGAIWVAAEHGLIKYKDGRPIVYSTANGLSDDNVLWLDQDRDGNMWLGTYSGGLCMLSGESIVGFGRSDGLPDAPVAKVFDDRAGRVYVSTRGAGIMELADGKVVPIKWSQNPEFSDIGLRIMQDAKGDWWVGTDEGLFLLQGTKLSKAHARRITAAEGGPETGVAGEIYEDPNHRVWLGSLDNKLFCIDRPSGGRPIVHQIPLSYAFPYRRLVSDRSGALWIGANALLSRVVDGQDSLVRPAEGEPQLDAKARPVWELAVRKWGPVEGLPETNTRAFLRDSRGRLWIGLRYKGVSVASDPSANPIKFSNYTTADGLSSNTVWSITEDSLGRIYFGTGRGLDRMDPTTGRIRHITAGEKLVGDSLVQCMRDRRGDIWIATANAVLRLDPKAEQDEGRAPPIYLTKVQAAGDEIAVPDVGAIQGPGLTLNPSGNNLLIEYVGLDFHSDHELKYQYKLEGADKDWSQPSDQRSVNYASLAPGSYRFLVRAVNQDGVVSPEPAVIQVRVLPPVWRRWWFLTAAAGLLALAAYAIHRRRVARLVEMLAVRTRIASDLHDDIGSNLTKIAILSEVANQQLGSQSLSAERPLSSIARISRESVASMADIVWAIDPRKDTQQDLASRMRQFAIDMLGAAGATVRMTVSGDAPQRLGPEFRRQVFLIFKEAINNAARHSCCSSVEIEVTMERRGLSLTVTDNGTGFDIDRDRDGHGLESMKTRAENLGGHLGVSTGDPGTVVTLFVPWTRPRVRAKGSSRPT